MPSMQSTIIQPETSSAMELSHAWIKIPVFMEASEGIRILTMSPLTILADAKGQEGRIDTLSAMRYNTDADTMSECSEGE